MSKQPTYQQLITTASVCQTLSDFYRPIVLFRYDYNREEFYILAGDQGGMGGIVIKSDNKVEFLDEQP